MKKRWFAFALALAILANVGCSSAVSGNETTTEEVTTEETTTGEETTEETTEEVTTEESTTEEMTTEEPTTEEPTTEEPTTAEPKKYAFLDVMGKYYEAELLPAVPKYAFDNTRIRYLNGFKYYVDETGTPISKLGIDVSKYQTNIDWAAVKAAGIDFVIVRCGFRGYGSGSLNVDPWFASHVSGALAAGLEVGVYFFSQAITWREAEEEAEFTLNLIKDYNITGPVVFDTEEIRYDDARTEGLTPTQFTDHCIAFCERIKAAGYHTMIYANMPWMAFTLQMERLTAYDFWYADYEPEPQCPYKISIWQYTDTGRVPGVNGNVDINVWFPEPKGAAFE